GQRACGGKRTERRSGLVYCAAMRPFELDTASVAAALEAADAPAPTDAVSALTLYLQLLVKWNRTYNLTGIRDPAELVERHLVESLALAPLLRGERVADVGTGAG